MILRALLCFACVTHACTSRQAIDCLSRRRLLAACAANAAACAAPFAAHAAAEPTFTKMDAFQLRASFNGLNDALEAWRVEMVQIQLGNEPTSVVAVAGLADSTLQHFAESGSSASVELFKKNRNSLLQTLYLARGAARYEKDPKVALDYIAKAKAEAEAARDSLGVIAETLGVELTKPRPRPATPAEDRIVFEPRPSTRVENKLVF